jgi:hypothetical protein
MPASQFGGESSLSARIRAGSRFKWFLFRFYGRNTAPPPRMKITALIQAMLQRDVKPDVLHDCFFCLHCPSCRVVTVIRFVCGETHKMLAAPPAVTTGRHRHALKTCAMSMIKHRTLTNSGVLSRAPALSRNHVVKQTPWL